MKHLFFTSIMFTICHRSEAQDIHPASSETAKLEYALSDVMEITDTALLKVKLRETEDEFRVKSSLLNKLRLGIIYHETALNLSFLSRTEFKGYAKRSFDILSELYNTPAATEMEMPYIASYRASALSLVSAETKNLKLLSEAFVLFDSAVKKYAEVSYLPEFLRGSVAENLPWYFLSKHRVSKNDFQSIIDKQAADNEYAGWKIMSFTYLARANQLQSKKHRTQTLSYLDKAIALDPDYKAGRKKAEELKELLIKKT